MYCLTRITLLIDCSQSWMDGFVGMVVICYFSINAKDESESTHRRQDPIDVHECLEGCHDNQ